MLSVASSKTFFILTIIAVLLPETSCAPRPERPNIALVVLDTVRRDFTGIFSSNDNRKSSTPQLDKLATEGISFSNAWANAPWTLPSHGSIFTGLLPSEHGSTGHHYRLDGESPTIAELLGRDGYETATFFSNPWLTNRLSGLMRGFQTQYAIGGKTNAIPSGPDQGGRATVRNISRWLEGRSRKRPFFIFVNFLESHLPYDPPRSFRGEVPTDEKVSIAWAHQFNAGVHPPESVDWERVRQLYGGDVRSADAFLAELVTLLKEDGYYENTVIIVTSDHGENLGEHGLIEHQFSVHETLLAVPLVISFPDKFSPKTRDDPVMLTDLFATVLALAGTEDPPLRPSSRSLLNGPADPNRPLIAEYAGPAPGLLKHLSSFNPDFDASRLKTAYATIRRGNYRLTVGTDGSVSLHELTTDPGQEINLAPANRSEVDSLCKFLPIPRPGGERTEIDDDLREQLRSLGYHQ